MLYKLYFTNNGLPQTGLSPTWYFFLKVSDGTAYTPQPTITEIGGGFYKFSITPTEDVVGVMDGGTTLTSASDRYTFVSLSPNDTNMTMIANIKSATDTINWQNITDIKAKTDTVNWQNITDVKAKTDTINWADITMVLDVSLGKWDIDIQANTLTLYRQNGTVLKTFTLTPTQSQVPAYITRLPSS